MMSDPIQQGESCSPPYPAPAGFSAMRRPDPREDPVTRPVFSP